MGWAKDDWPDVLGKVLATDILVIGSAIWLGEKTSVCTKVIERLYSASHNLNAHGHYVYYGKVGVVSSRGTRTVRNTAR